MSLSVVKFFNQALRASTSVMSETEGRIFPIARPYDADQGDKIPYIIITHEGLSSDGDKDDPEQVDTAKVNLIIVAETYEKLVELEEYARDAIHIAYMDGADSSLGFTVDGYEFSVGTAQYDADKPCYWQEFNYTVETQNS